MFILYTLHDTEFMYDPGTLQMHGAFSDVQDALTARKHLQYTVFIAAEPWQGQVLWCINDEIKRLAEVEGLDKKGFMQRLAYRERSIVEGVKANALIGLQGEQPRPAVHVDDNGTGANFYIATVLRLEPYTESVVHVLGRASNMDEAEALLILQCSASSGLEENDKYNYPDSKWKLVLHRVPIEAVQTEGSTTKKDISHMSKQLEMLISQYI